MDMVKLLLGLMQEDERHAFTALRLYEQKGVALSEKNVNTLVKCVFHCVWLRHFHNDVYQEACHEFVDSIEILSGVGS